jgi:hypothetical protein
MSQVLRIVLVDMLGEASLRDLIGVAEVRHDLANAASDLRILVLILLVN